jgi:hypothetical protein
MPPESLPAPGAGNGMFVDANVFLRYLTNDVPEQADAVDAS